MVLRENDSLILRNYVFVIVQIFQHYQSMFLFDHQKIKCIPKYSRGHFMIMLYHENVYYVELACYQGTPKSSTFLLFFLLVDISKKYLQIIILNGTILLNFHQKSLIDLLFHQYRIFRVEDYIIKMNQFQNDKYSIKKNLASSANNQSDTTKPTSKMKIGDKIYMPEYYDFFLQTVDKEIKHEGDLLRKIKSKIKDFKSQKVGRKGCEDQVNHYSRNIFTSHSGRKSHQRQKTSGQNNMSTIERKSAKRYMNSASTSVRQTLKMKTSSFSIDFPKNMNNKRCLSRELSNILFNNSMTSAKVENQKEKENIQKIERHMMAHKKSSTTLQMTITGNKPNWNNFECYRTNGSYLVKKANF